LVGGFPRAPGVSHGANETVARSLHHPGKVGLIITDSFGMRRGTMEFRLDLFGFRFKLLPP
jgi:hypothetical protein